jgi:kynurenine formamidase
MTNSSNCNCCNTQSAGVEHGGRVPSTTAEELGALFKKVCNWGRWGAEDQRGTLNLIGSREIAQAAALVQEGRHLSLSRNLPTQPGIENPRPAQHYMIADGEDRHSLNVPGMEATFDFIGIAFHGLSCSHLDALCHIFRDGRMYNDRPASDVRSRGATRNTVMAAADGIVSRGVLLDIPRALGIDFVEPDHLITLQELEIAEAHHGVKVGTGDILLVRTGRDVQPARGDGKTAGLHPYVAGWLYERSVAVLGGDGSNDAIPWGLSAWAHPIHEICIASMGMMLLDNLYLDSLSEHCSTSRRYAFQLVVAPLLIEGGTGSPVNPIAIF